MLEKRLRVFWVYECSPIDNWWGWTPLTTVLQSSKENNDLEEEGLGAYIEDWRGFPFEKLALEASTAKLLIQKHTLWEGDGHWQVAPLPNPDQCTSELLFAVKQSNNGTTFLCSPFRLPWLADSNNEQPFKISWPSSEILALAKEYLPPEDEEDEDMDEDAYNEYMLRMRVEDDS